MGPRTASGECVNPMNAIRRLQSAEFRADTIPSSHKPAVEPTAPEVMAALGRGQTMSTRDEPPSSAPEELTRLLEKAIGRVHVNVDKSGFSIPMAFALSPDGHDIVIVADSFDEDEPAPCDARLDLKRRSESILFNIRRMIGRGQLRAVAFARNLAITLDSDAGPVPRKAVKVILDHEHGGGSVAYLIYDPNGGSAKPLELFHEALDDRFFPEGGWPPDKPREPLVPAAEPGSSS